MPRPNDEKLRDWSMPYATKERGTCEAKSAELKARTWAPLDRPIATRMISVYIDCGYAQNHWAFVAKWEGDEAETVIDNTIGQFGDVVMVFVGSIDQWIAKLGELLNTDKIRLDPGEDLFNAAFHKETEYAFAAEQRRHAASVSKDTHMAETLRKKLPKKKDDSGCCVIL